jgi:hypothetical protein
MNLMLSPEFSPPAVAVPLAQQAPPDAPGGQGEDFGKSSPVALVVMILFFVAVVLLVRSMNKHLRRIPESFDPPQERSDDDTGDR